MTYPVMVYAVGCVILLVFFVAIKSHRQHFGQQKIIENNVGDAIISTVRLDKPYIDEELVSRYYSTISITVQAGQIHKVVKRFIFRNDAILYHKDLVRKFRENERSNQYAK